MDVIRITCNINLTILWLLCCRQLGGY